GELSLRSASFCLVVLHCVTRSGLDKLIFGKGTKLIVETKKVEPPAFYKFNDYCLATDFTQHNAVNETLKNVTPVRYSGKDYYSSFSFSGSENCRETSRNDISNAKKIKKISNILLHYINHLYSIFRLHVRIIQSK
uniref:T-cell receptor alpha joining 39 n=1 Tax=Cyprinus carpio carpio TaxID=630221 RepID=A0A9J7ZAF0_CYPCA